MNPEDENCGKLGEHELNAESRPSESNGDQTSSIGDTYTDSTYSARHMYTPEANADLIGATHADCDKVCQGFLYDAVILTPDKHNEDAFKLKTWLEQNLWLHDYGGAKHCARVELLGNIRPDSYAGSLEIAPQQTQMVILHCVKGFEGDAMFKEAMNDLWPFKSQGLKLCPLLVNFEKEDKVPMCISVWTAHTLRWEDRDSAHFRDAMVKRLSFTLAKRLSHDEVRRECEQKRNLWNRRPVLKGPRSLQWVGSTGLKNEPCGQQENTARKGEEDTRPKSTRDSGFSSALTSHSMRYSYAADRQLLYRGCSSGPHELSAQRECLADVHDTGTNESTARNSSSAQLCSDTMDDTVGSDKDETMERPNAEAQRMTDVNREFVQGRPTETPRTQNGYVVVAGKNVLDGYLSMWGTDKRSSRGIESKPRRDGSTTEVVADVSSRAGRDLPLDSKGCSQSKDERSECSFQFPPPAKDRQSPSGEKLLLTHSGNPTKSVDCDGAQTVDTRHSKASEKQPQGPTEKQPIAEKSTSCESESETAQSVTSQTSVEGDIVSDLDTDGSFNAHSYSGTGARPKGESPKHRTPQPSSSPLHQPLELTTAPSNATSVKNGCHDSYDEYTTVFQDERLSRGASGIGSLSHASAEEKHEKEPPAGCENRWLNENNYLTPVDSLSHEQYSSYDTPYRSRKRTANDRADEKRLFDLLAHPCDEDSKSMDINNDNKLQIEIDRGAASVTRCGRVSPGQNDVSTHLSKIKTDFQNNLKFESTSEAPCVTYRNCHGLQNTEKSHRCRIEPRWTHSTPVSCLCKKHNNSSWHCSQALENNKSDTDNGSVVLRPGTSGTIQFEHVCSVIVHNYNSVKGHPCCRSEEAVTDTSIPVDSHKTLPTAPTLCSSHLSENDYNELDGSLENEKELCGGKPDLPPRGPYQNGEWALEIGEQPFKTTSSSRTSRLIAMLCCGRKKRLAKN